MGSCNSVPVPTAMTPTRKARGCSWGGVTFLTKGHRKPLDHGRGGCLSLP